VQGTQPKYGAEVAVGDTGEFLYVSSRSDDGGVLVVFKILTSEQGLTKVDIDFKIKILCVTFRIVLYSKIKNESIQSFKQYFNQIFC
jgi:hypothetical protein